MIDSVRLLEAPDHEFSVGAQTFSLEQFRGQGLQGTGGEIGDLGIGRLLSDGKGALNQSLGIGSAALRLIDHRESIESVVERKI